MDRRKFLARFGLGTVGAVVATKVVVDASQEVEKDYPSDLGAEASIAGAGWLDQIEKTNRFTYQIYTDQKGQKAWQEAVEKLTERS